MALWGITDEQKSVPKYLNRGQVITVTVADGGSGFEDEEDITFAAAPGGGITATGYVLVDEDGAITEVVVSNPGAGYTSAPAITGGSGTGATLTAKIAPVAVSHTQIVFVDEDEAMVPANRNKGIKTPGWNLVRSKVDSQGNERFFVDPLVAVSIYSGDSGDANDDTIVGDNDNFSITLAPTDETVETGQGVTFAVETSEKSEARVTLTFSSMANGNTVTINGLTLTASGAITAGGVARAFYQAIGGDAITPAINGTFSGEFDLADVLDVVGFSFDDATMELATIEVGTFDILDPLDISASGVTAPTTSNVSNGSNGAGSFQWQRRTTGNYSNISNGGVFSGATTGTLTISNVAGMDGNKFRCVCLNVDADTTIVTKPVTLTVTS